MPSCGDYIMHFLPLPWKLIFAFIPPTGKNVTQYNYTVTSTRQNNNMSFLQRCHFKIAYICARYQCPRFVRYQFHKYALLYRYHAERKQESQSRAERKCIPASRHLATFAIPPLCSHLIKDNGGLQFQIRTPSALVLTLVPNITRQKVLE